MSDLRRITGVRKCAAQELVAFRPKALRRSWLLDIREEILDLTQPEFAAVLGMHVNTYQRRESDPNSLTSEEYRHVLAILEAHGTDSRGRIRAAGKVG